MKRARRPLVFLVALGASLLGPGSAGAADLALVFDVGLRTMSNSTETEKAIFDKKSGWGAGLGLSYDQGSRWRFGLDARRIGRDGERAFAADRTSPAFRLGHPLTLTIIEGVASVGYRFGRMGPVSPYITIGGGVASWKERSDIAGLTETASGKSALFEGRIGFERKQGLLRLGIEGGITVVPNAIGLGGISQIYEESDLGGLFVAARIGFSRR